MTQNKLLLVCLLHHVMLQYISLNPSATELNFFSHSRKWCGAFFSQGAIATQCKQAIVNYSSFARVINFVTTKKQKVRNEDE